MELLLDPWSSGIARRALLEVALIGAVCGPLAFWVTTYRLSYAAESLAHALLPGLVLAALTGAPLLIGAAAGVTLAAALIEAAGRDARIGPDTATAVVVTGMVGAGAVVALAPDAPPRLVEMLFGDPLSASDADLALGALLALIGGVALAALHRPLAALALDPGAAGALGLPAPLLRLSLLGLLAATTAVAAQGLGNLLVLAVLVAPAVAVRRHVRTAAGAILGGGVLAVAAGMLGIYVSFHVGAAAGGAVALALCAAAAVGAALPARRPGRP